MIRMLVFNKIERIEKYYNENTNTYEFIKNGEMQDVKFNFDLKVDENIMAGDIKALDMDVRDIHADNIEAFDIKAHDIYAFDIKAFDIKARKIDTYDIEADNIKAYSINATTIKADSIVVNT